MNNIVGKGIRKIKREGIGPAVTSYFRKREKNKDYLETIRQYHLPDERTRQEQKQFRFDYERRISVITPLYNTPQEYLIQLIESLLKQTYRNWELCLADGSDDEHSYVRKICSEYMKKDSRIVYKKLDHNEGIVGNTNQAIQFATGEYYGLLDHDDILHESALFECMKVIQDGADFIYTDEMKFEKDIRNSIDIVCKSDFGKDELRSHNYICHFVVFNRNLLIGMSELYRKECEGSQDYDMVLRLTERAQKIVHIPKILYYWRVHAGSVAMNLSVKQYAVEAAKRAIENQLCRSGERGSVSCNLPYETIYRIKYEIPEAKLITICLWGEEKKKLLENVRDLIEHTKYRPLEVLIPSEQTLSIDEDNVKVISLGKQEIKNRYQWFERARENANGEYLVYLNYECKPMVEDWVEELLMYAQRSDVGVVGANIIHGNHQVYFAGGVLDQDERTGIHVINYNLIGQDQGYEANMRHVRNTSILSSLCLMVAKNQLGRLGGFRMDLGDCGDADLCLRSKEQKLWNVWNCFAQMYYNGEKDIQDYWIDNEKFRQIWKSRIIEGDGYYHPLLKRLGKM